MRDWRRAGWNYEAARGSLKNWLLSESVNQDPKRMEEATANHIFQSKDKETVDKTLLWLHDLTATQSRNIFGGSIPIGFLGIIFYIKRQPVCLVLLLQQASKRGKLGILWNHNNEGNSGWLEKCKEIIDTKTQDFVWWDVGWRSPRSKSLSSQAAGFIYTTAEKQVTHTASVESIVPQPDMMFAKKVEANWRKLGLPFSENDPLHEYLRGESEVLTLLKLSKIKAMNPPNRLENFKLQNGKSATQPPLGFYYVTVP